MDSLVVFTHKFVNLRRKAPLRQSGLLFLPSGTALPLFFDADKKRRNLKEKRGEE